MKSNLLFAVTVATLGASVAAAAATAPDSYPARPIRLIVPFSPSGSVDIIGRMVGAGLTTRLGQQVVIDNRTGASGNIGTDIAAHANSDGYTLLIHTIPFVANTFMYRKLPYSVTRDFDAVALISSSPSLLAVNPKVAARSPRDLLELARAKPGALNYATAGPGTNPHIAGELFNYLGKVNLVAVHFRGGGPGLIATIAGDVEVTFSNFSSTIPHVRSKRLRGLGVSSLQRVATMPELPTIAESALPGYEFVAWHAIVAPKGTPKQVIRRLNSVIKVVLAEPDVKKRFSDRGLTIIASTPEELSAHLARELKKWGPVIKERGMRRN